MNAHSAAAGRRFNRTLVQCQTRVRTLKHKQRYKEELLKQPASGWCHLPRLHAFLASPDESTPGFPAKAPAFVKQEVVVLVEEEEEKEKEKEKWPEEALGWWGAGLFRGGRGMRPQQGRDSARGRW